MWSSRGFEDTKKCWSGYMQSCFGYRCQWWMETKGRTRKEEYINLILFVSTWHQAVMQCLIIAKLLLHFMPVEDLHCSLSNHIKYKNLFDTLHASPLTLYTLAAPIPYSLPLNTGLQTTRGPLKRQANECHWTDERKVESYLRSFGGQWWWEHNVWNGIENQKIICYEDYCLRI